MSQVLNMRYPKELLKRIDEFKKRRVSQLVPKQLFISFNMHLNSWTIEMVSSHPLFKGDSSPTYLLSFLEVGVFSPKMIKSIDGHTKKTLVTRSFYGLYFFYCYFFCKNIRKKKTNLSAYRFFQLNIKICGIYS